eukprot:jgi/Botrbrau1/3765/Bobra.0183s0002.1
MASELSTLIDRQLSRSDRTESLSTESLSCPPTHHAHWHHKALRNLSKQPCWRRDWWTKERITISLTVAFVTVILAFISCTSGSTGQRSTYFLGAPPAVLGVPASTYTTLIGHVHVTTRNAHVSSSFGEYEQLGSKDNTVASPTSGSEDDTQDHEPGQAASEPFGWQGNSDRKEEQQVPEEGERRPSGTSWDPARPVSQEQEQLPSQEGGGHEQGSDWKGQATDLSSISNDEESPRQEGMEASLNSWSPDSAQTQDTTSGQSEAWQGEQASNDEGGYPQPRTEDTPVSEAPEAVASASDGQQGQPQENGDWQPQESDWEASGEEGGAQEQSENNDVVGQGSSQADVQPSHASDDAQQLEDGSAGEAVDGGEERWVEGEGQDQEWEEHVEQQQRWMEQAANAEEASTTLQEGGDTAVQESSSAAALSWPAPADSGLLNLQAQPDIQEP